MHAHKTTTTNALPRTLLDMARFKGWEPDLEGSRIAFSYDKPYTDKVVTVFVPIDADIGQSLLDWENHAIANPDLVLDELTNPYGDLEATDEDRDWAQELLDDAICQAGSLGLDLKGCTLDMMET